MCRIDFSTNFSLLTLINTKVCSVRIANPDRTDNFIYHDPNRIKYKDHEAHKSEPLKLSKLTLNKWILLIGKTIMTRDELNIS